MLSVFDGHHISPSDWNTIDVDRFIALSDSRGCLTDGFMLHRCV